MLGLMKKKDDLLVCIRCGVKWGRQLLNKYPMTEDKWECPLGCSQSKQHENHMSLVHKAKLAKDSEGRLVWNTKVYNIPTKIGKLLDGLCNECWFCVLEKLEKLENGKKQQVEIELLIDSKAHAHHVISEFEKLGYQAITKDNYLFKITK